MNLALLLAVMLLVVAVQAPNRIVPAVLRLAAIAVPAMLITAYFTVPFLIDKAFLNASPYLQRWKYDSYGANEILGWLLKGDLFDYGRFPVMTIVLVIGIVWAISKRTEPAWLALVLFFGSLLVYFGRPTLGKLADLLPLHDGLLLHRFSAGVDLGAILLIGLGGEWIWRQCAKLPARWSPAIATLAIAILMAPALRERYHYYSLNTQMMRETKTALDADRDAATIIATLKTLPPGRAYAGLRTNWGNEMKWGSLRFSDLLTFNQIPAVSPPYQSLSLNSDLIWHFNDNEAAHYKLFNVRYVIAPSKLKLTTFFAPIKKTPGYTLYQVDSGGYAQFTHVADWKTADSQRSLFDRNLAWMLSPDPAASRFIRWSYMGTDPGPGLNPWDLDGAILNEKVRPGQIDEIVRAGHDSTLVFKMTYHPDWHLEIDGREHPGFMVSPSFIGVTVPAGTHVVSANYKSNRLKDFLLVLAPIVVILTLIFGASLSGRLETYLKRLVFTRRVS